MKASTKNVGFRLSADIRKLLDDTRKELNAQRPARRHTTTDALRELLTAGAEARRAQQAA